MKIKNYLTTRNYTASSNKKNKYIVIHYVGAVSSALANAKYFKTTYRGASAHYFVDENEIYRVVEDKNIAWHVGAKTYKHANCRNSNSIGIEMCCYRKADGTLDVSEKVVARTIELTKELMAIHNIPAENVIRHYDVTGKNCPAPMVLNSTRWNNFKSKLGNVTSEKNPSNTTPVSVSTKYLVKIATDVLNVREKANANSAIKTTVKKGEVYTIIEEQNGWGKLKSGAGWIKLSYTIKTSNATSSTLTTYTYYPACNNKYTSLVEGLKSIGVDSSYSNRKKIAVKNNIPAYTGKAIENERLLAKLKAGKLIRI